MEWKKLLKSSATLVLGFALGVAVLPLLHRPPPPPFGPPPPIGPFLEHFSAEFDLTDEQRNKAKQVFEEQREKAEAMHREIFPRFERIREETRERIRAILSPEQQVKFDRLHAERGPPGGPFPPPPPPPPPF